MGRLDGKVALVTGAASGFGEAIAHSFAREGAGVIIADIDVKNSERVANEILAANADADPGVHWIHFDCTRLESWHEALDLAKRQFDRLDVVVNNAGTTYRKKPSVDVTESEFDRIVAVNIKSIYLSVVAIMPYFVERRSGVFVNTSSTAATRVRPGQVFYGGTKGFVNTITQGLAAEYGPSGVRVNSVCPVRGATGLLEMFSGVPDTREERDRFAQTIPLGRMSAPEDVAAAVVYLASDDAAYITGVCLPVDGGRLAV